MDPRLAMAVRTSTRWYDDVFALHGIKTRARAGLWRSLGPPPLHSAVKTLTPAVDEADVLSALADSSPVTVADSFGTLQLGAEGFQVLIDASWIHRSPLTAPVGSGGPPGWRRVRDQPDLDRWLGVHGSEGVFRPAILGLPAFHLMAREDASGDVDAVVVLHEAGPVVGVSNTTAAPGASLGWTEVLDLVAHRLPDRPVTDYTSGEDLADAVDAGFTVVGPQLVWLRDKDSTNAR